MPLDRPFVNFSTRIDVETADRRRRLEKLTGLGTRYLVAEAFRHFERLVLTKRRACDQPDAAVMRHERVATS